MYINKFTRILFIIVAAILFNSCSEPKGAPYVPYEKYLDGNIRSFDMLNDTLFVASEEIGIMIYEIINDKFIINSRLLL